MAAAYDDPSLGLQLLKVTCVDEIRTLRDRHHLCEHEAGQAASRKETSRLKQRCCRYTLHAGRLAIPNDRTADADWDGHVLLFRAGDL